jgi:transcriptional regulator with XRE-family HTH domain
MSNSRQKLTPLILRKRSGKTQQEIATAIGRRKAAVSGWEQGRRSPILKIHEIRKFMAAYEATLDELIEAFSNGDEA